MAAYWFLFHQGNILLTDKGTIPLSKEIPFPNIEESNIFHLPDVEERSCYAATLETPITESCYKMIPLRASFEMLPSILYRMAAKSYELLYWNANTNYCGACGALMKRHTEISKICSCCGKEIWPSASAAIIVAITRGHEILLVQSKKFRGNYFGLVAGFVETGETLEECVHREVMEETGITIKKLKYFSSQAWPYPFNIMIGFTAEYAHGDLQLQRSELNAGGWYKLNNLPEIPGKVSLARQLIDAVKNDICHQ